MQHKIKYDTIKTLSDYYPVACSIFGKVIAKKQMGPDFMEHFAHISTACCQSNQLRQMNLNITQYIIVANLHINTPPSKFTWEPFCFSFLSSLSALLRLSCRPTSETANSNILFSSKTSTTLEFKHNTYKWLVSTFIHWPIFSRVTAPHQVSEQLTLELLHSQETQKSSLWLLAPLRTLV